MTTPTRAARPGCQRAPTKAAGRRNHPHGCGTRTCRPPAGSSPRVSNSRRHLRPQPLTAAATAETATTDPSRRTGPPAGATPSDPIAPVPPRTGRAIRGRARSARRTEDRPAAGPALVARAVQEGDVAASPDDRKRAAPLSGRTGICGRCRTAGPACGRRDAGQSLTGEASGPLRSPSARPGQGGPWPFAADEADHQPPLAEPRPPQGGSACGRVGPQPSRRLHQATMLRRCRDSTSTAMTISHTPTTGSTNGTAPRRGQRAHDPHEPHRHDRRLTDERHAVLTSAKTTTAPIPTKGSTASNVPRAHATPLPPCPRRNGENMCPSTTASPATRQARSPSCAAPRASAGRP